VTTVTALDAPLPPAEPTAQPVGLRDTLGLLANLGMSPQFVRGRRAA
jgi:hypothetical protein